LADKDDKKKDPQKPNPPAGSDPAQKKPPISPSNKTYMDWFNAGLADALKKSLAKSGTRLCLRCC
jgi:hypothetical protein